MTFPRTELELDAQGYVFEGVGRCRACNAALERLALQDRLDDERDNGAGDCVSFG